MADRITTNLYDEVDTGSTSTNIYDEVDTSSSSPKTKTQSLYDRLGTPSRQQSALVFPSDLGAEGHTGTIRFKITLPEGSKYGGGGSSPINNTNGETVGRTNNKNSLRDRLGGNSRAISSIIDLYMPPQVQTSYGTDWAWQGLGSIGAAVEAADAASQIKTFEDALKTAKDSGEVLKTGTISTLSKILDRFIGTNTGGTKQLVTGSITNPYMELMFEGINPRTFSFTFKMTPRNKKEASAIKDIVHEFKFHQAPEVKVGASHYWTVPSEFDIEFMYKGASNPWVHKISTCACTGVDVDYASEGMYAPHKDGSPFTTILTLTFQEMELLTKERIEQGY